ncbi:MAG: SIS domain-containing protein [Bauldia sp.]
MPSRPVKTPPRKAAAQKRPTRAATGAPTGAKTKAPTGAKAPIGAKPKAKAKPEALRVEAEALAGPQDFAPLFARLHDEHQADFLAARTLLPATAALARAVISTLERGGKVLLCGNGGSAADAQHIATELTVRFEAARRGLAAVALTTDTSTLTAAANDLGYAQVFARQVEALGRPGDLLLALTTSGNSPSILAALTAARGAGIATACLTGRDGGEVAREGLADHCLIVPSAKTARIQEVHIFLGHLICAAADAEFAWRG